MIQRLLLLFVSLAVVSNYAHGLGLGKLELQSALNQEFRAEIELTNVGGLSDEEILPKLASQDDFERVGVERNYLLTDLRFKVTTNDAGKTIVLVSSTKPIIEPFLNFLVEVIWPNGRILREYTVLLDPPRFGNAGVAPLATAQSASSAQSAAQPASTRQEPAKRTSAATNMPRQTAKPAPSRDEGEIVDGEYGVTGPGDTLWKIAARVRPDDSVSIQQTMLALQRANPNAFINNNINLLKAGYVLRVPDAAEIRSEGKNNAVAEVQVQNEEFADYRSGGLAQLDATRRPSRNNNTAAQEEDGELKLLASNSSSGRRAGDSGGASAAVQNDLAAAREDLDRARRASSEMQVRLDDLQEQIETLNELVQLKDDQLAALRSELQKQQGDAPAAAPAAATTPAAAAGGGSLLSNPMVLGGVLLLLVALVIGGMVFYRRRQQATMDDDDELGVELPELDETPDAIDDSIDIEEELVGLEEDEELAPQTSDVISEAEIYIAYGRFPQAITFLQNAIEAEPNRADIQLKLLEVFVQTEDATAFNLQLEQMQMLGDEEANARGAEMQRQIPGAAEAAGVVLDDEPEEQAISLDDDADDDELSFDLDDLDAETDDDELSLDLEDDEGATLILDSDDGGELDLGEELELDLDDDADTALLDDDSLDLDLDLDDDDDDDVTQIRPRAQPAEDDELDLDLDLEDSDELSLDLDSGDELDLDLGADDELELDLGDDDLELDLGDDDLDLDLGDDDELSLDLDADDELSLDLDDDSAADDALDLDDLALDDDADDDVFELDLDADDDDLDLDLGDESLDLGNDLDDDLQLDDELTLDLDDDDLGELDLDDDASGKLDLARAYIDMGDSDGARELLQDVLKVGTEGDIQEANELLAKLD